jgi:rod shape-determining protein MreC
LARPRRSRRTLTTLIVLVLVSLTAITLDETGGTHHLTAGIKTVASDLFSPLRNGVNDVLRPVGDFFAGAFHYGSLQAENHKLQYTIGQLRQADAERAYQQQQLRDLLALQNLPFVDALPTVTAQTTAIDISNFDADITINKGRSDGVDYGMPVVGAGGLVGQVVQANHHSAIVQLVTDGQSKVGVVQVGSAPGSTGATALVYGQGPGELMTATFGAAGVTIHKGDQLATNGLQGGGFPPGIPVGTVASSKVVSGGTQIDVGVKPSANLDTLAYVDVVQWEPQT